MNLTGRVHNGVVVFDGNVSLPEGAEVTVFCRAASPTPAKGKRVRFPLIESGRPDTMNLTNERIAEILEEEDVAYYSQVFVK